MENSLSYMFYNCYSLNSFPDLSKWEIQEFTDTKDIIKGCDQFTKTIKLPKFAK